MAHEIAITVEDEDFERDVRVIESGSCREPSSSGDGVSKRHRLGDGVLERFRDRVSGAYFLAQRSMCASFNGNHRERFEVGQSALRMHVEHPLGELCHLGDAAGNRDSGNRMAPTKSPMSISAISDRSWNFRTAASDVEPVAPATWASPAARATSMP